MPEKKKTSKKAPAKASGSKAVPAKGATTKSASKRSAAKTASPPSATASVGDLIVIESEKVGSPPREGEVLEIVQGKVSVSYLVRWSDGHQSLIAPGAGNTRIVRSKQTR